MEDENWYNNFNDLVETEIDRLIEIEYINKADIGLIISVISDYIENGKDSIERDLITLKIAEKVLDIKESYENISWFDIYEIIFEYSSENKKKEKLDNKSYSFDDFEKEIFKENIELDSHKTSFKKAYRSMFESFTSERAKELYDTDKVENYNRFTHSLSVKSNFSYGSVEIPNNLNRMKATDELLPILERIPKEEYNWVIVNIKEWVKKYSRAEAHLANNILSSKDLNQFMHKSKNPSEKYWGWDS